jgi:L-threonylcarbamoyladenylate synthase
MTHLEVSSGENGLIVYRCCVRSHTRKCASIIKDGGILVYPTDTVYGIGCDPYLDKAVEKIIEIKGRSGTKPFPVLASNIKYVERIALLGKIGKHLATMFWPGALTIISPLVDPKISKYVTGGKSTIGVRVPNNKCTAALLKQCKYLVGTSANESGKIPSTSVSDVIVSSLRGFDAILDGGKIKKSVESTILDLTGSVPKLIREGAISSKEISEVLSGYGL